ncbi:acyl transferase domain-containing protein [Saccharothrix coeruleofusca]|uniref:type I polyketide synthase n=1 Tax=Saccharothrix coeruleofusca TaxID=33919 RepID=UPI001AE5B8A8|nr:type I polyketide synthase [Saccharothrix coeruleofusca]MBP2335997.1 acyl transferase domain-containing protein [Saccharothrix coeruleofusca]
MSSDELAVAIVGMAVRLPGCDDLDQYWDGLVAGRSWITRRGRVEGEFVPAYGALAGAGRFDPTRFGMSEAEALLVDPQQRILLQLTDEALAMANVDPGQGRSVSVYAGAGRNDYERWVGTALAGRPGVDEMALEVANGRDYAATRISYRLGMTGAAVNVQSACSSALVAVHLACQDLLGYASDVAVAATAAVRVPSPRGYAAPSGGIGSPDGVCRPFDAGANGTVPGDGAGAVVLKRLADATADGDEILAVIRGSAVNNDGSAKSGFAGVNSRAQRDVVRAALDVAGVTPEEIDFVEAHGSGTRLGDAAEWASLAEVFADAGHPVRVGAVKANVGHLREAAGMAALAKVILCLRHGRFVPTPNFQALPADLARHSGVLTPSADEREWDARPDGVRLAGVSSFGLGGTNCHLVVQSAPPPAPGGGGRSGLLLVSSHSQETLEQDTEALRQAVEDQPDRVGDIAFTTQTGRRRLRHRRFVVVGEGEAFAAERLRVQTATTTGATPRVGFLLPGIGSHYRGMGAGLAANMPVFAKHLDAVLDIADRLTGGTVRAQFTEPAPATTGADRIDMRALLRKRDAPVDPGQRLRELHLGLFCFEHALASTVMELGVRPAVLVGHSLGEWVASVLSGVLGVEDAMAAVARRAELITLAGPGRMLAVLAPVDEVERFVGDDVWVAADNGPMHCVLSGRPEGVARIEQVLRREGLTVLDLGTSHPFHTPQLDGAAERLGDDLRDVPLGPPRIPLASSVLGQWLDRVPAPEYWRHHMTSRVRFRSAVRLALEHVRVLVEIGPGTTRPWVVQADPDVACVKTVRQSYEQVPDEQILMEALGQLWLHGVEADWAKLHEPRPARVRLPRPRTAPRRFLPDAPPPPGPTSVPQGLTGAVAPAAIDPAEQAVAAAPATSTQPPPGAAEEWIGRVPGAEVLADHLGAQWRALLGLRELHPDDHFFHLGGDSLMGVHLIAGIRRLSGKEVPSSVVFASARFGEMVEHVHRWLTEEEGVETDV